LTETIIDVRSVEPVEVPDAGEIVSQVFVFDAVQLRVPSPAFQIIRVWFSGFDPLTVALKSNSAELRPILVGVLVKVRVTGIVLGEFEAKESLMVIVS